MGVENRFPSGQTRLVSRFVPENTLIRIRLAQDQSLRSRITSWNVSCLDFQWVIVKCCKFPQNALGSGGSIWQSGLLSPILQYSLPSINSKRRQGAKQPYFWDCFYSRHKHHLICDRPLWHLYQLITVTQSNRPHNGHPHWGDGKHTLVDGPEALEQLLFGPQADSEIAETVLNTVISLVTFFISPPPARIETRMRYGCVRSRPIGIRALLQKTLFFFFPTLTARSEQK